MDIGDWVSWQVHVGAVPLDPPPPPPPPPPYHPTFPPRPHLPPPHYPPTTCPHGPAHLRACATCLPYLHGCYRATLPTRKRLGLGHTDAVDRWVEQADITRRAFADGFTIVDTTADRHPCLGRRDTLLNMTTRSGGIPLRIRRCLVGYHVLRLLNWTFWRRDRRYVGWATLPSGLLRCNKRWRLHLCVVVTGHSRTAVRRRDVRRTELLTCWFNDRLLSLTYQVASLDFPAWVNNAWLLYYTDAVNSAGIGLRHLFDCGGRSILLTWAVVNRAALTRTGSRDAVVDGHLTPPRVANLIHSLASRSSVLPPHALSLLRPHLCADTYSVTYNWANAFRRAA